MTFTFYRPSLRAIGAIAVLLAWMASLGWLGWRESHQTAAAQLSSEAALRLAPGGSWFAILSGSEPIGSAGITLDTLSPGYRIITTESFDVPVGDSLVHDTWRADTRLGATLNVDQITARYTTTGRSIDWSIDAAGDSLVVRSRAGILRALGRVRPPIHPVFPASLSYRVALSGVAAQSRTRTLQLADGWPPTIRAGSVAAGPESTVVYTDSSRLDPVEGWVPAHAQAARAVAVVVDGPLGPYRLWIDHRGSVMGRETPLGVTWRRTDFDLAVSRFRRRAPLNGARIRGAVATVVPLAAGTANVDTFTTTRRFLAMHLDGSPVDTALLALLAGGRQSVTGDTIIVAPAADPAVHIGSHSVAADPMIQSESHAIDAFAAPFDGMVPEPIGLAGMMRAIHHAVRLDTAVSAPSDALGTLAAHRGSAAGIARLFVAVARAAGIAARYVVGVVPADGRLYTHAWAEVWSPGGRGGWFAVDPVRGLVPAPTNLIRLAYAGSATPEEMLPLVANARLVPLPAAGSRKEMP
jgi:Transglutaminase-like superfamily